MSIFSNLTTEADIEDEKDSVGSDFSILPSGLYDFTIDLAYVDTSAGGAKSVNFTFKNQEGKTLKVTEWVASGDAKGNRNYYVDRAGKKKYLPGFITVNNICLLSCGKELSEVEVEEKVINVWDSAVGKVAPTKKMVITDLIGEDISLGVLKQVENKNVKDSSGNYVPSNEKREVNIIDKVFRTKDMLTVIEIKGEQTEAKFAEDWKARNTDRVVDKFKPVEEVPVTASNEEQPKKKSLFG